MLSIEMKSLGKAGAHMKLCLPVPLRPGPGVVGTGAMYKSFGADFVFSFASFLTRLALLGLAVPLKRLLRSQRAGVSAN
jgi:hypothetical protein